MDVNTLANLPPWEWPPESAGVLAGVLSDPNATAKDRLLAAELSGEFVGVGDDVVRTLLAVVSDRAEPAELRARAAISLGPTLEAFELDMFDEDEPDEPKISAPAIRDIQSGLHNAYLDADAPKLLRRRALEASVRAPAPWHEGAVRAAYYSGDPEWLLTAVFCMEYMDGFETEILEALESEDPQVEYHAVRAAGNHEIGAAWPQVRALVSSPETDRPLLLAAIHAVASIRPREAPNALRTLAESDDEEISDTVYEALSMAGVGEDLSFHGFDDDEDIMLSGRYGNGSHNADEDDEDLF
jgi:hypothetical protein